MTVSSGRFLHCTGSVYITAQRRLFLCTCLHVLLLKFLKPSALGERLQSTCEPLIDGEKSPVSESWGKHSITNWSLNEGHHRLGSAWKERDGGERSCGVAELFERHSGGGLAQTPAFVCKFPTRTQQLLLFLFSFFFFKFN